MLTYEETDPTIDSQIVAFKTAGANTFYNVASPKFATQAIRKASEIGWKPLQFLSFISQSISGVLEPAGLENSVGIISAYFAKDPADPKWREDANTKDFLDWLQKYYPEAKPNDIFVAAGYNYAQILVVVLKQCGDDLSRDNILHQATNLHDVPLPWLLPGITLNTSSTNYQPIGSLREQRFNGKTWELIDKTD